MKVIIQDDTKVYDNTNIIAIVNDIPFNFSLKDGKWEFDVPLCEKFIIRVICQVWQPHSAEIYENQYDNVFDYDNGDMNLLFSELETKLISHNYQDYDSNKIITENELWYNNYQKYISLEQHIDTGIGTKIINLGIFTEDHIYHYIREKIPTIITEKIYNYDIIDFHLNYYLLNSDRLIKTENISFRLKKEELKEETQKVTIYTDNKHFCNKVNIFI